jgi:hypothetical protein
MTSRSWRRRLTYVPLPDLMNERLAQHGAVIGAEVVLFERDEKGRACPAP